MAWQEKIIYGDGAKGHHRFTLKVVEDSTSVITNKSYVHWEFILSPTVTWYDWEYLNQVPVNYIVNINGERYDGNIMTYDGVSTVVIRSGNMYVDHNADGNKRIDFNFSVWSLDIYYLPGAASASGYMDLTTIPRHAKITSAPTTLTDLDTPTIRYSNPAGGAVESLQACIAYYINGTQALYASYRDIDPNKSEYTFTDGFDKDLLYRSFTNTNGPIRVQFYVTSRIGGVTEYSILEGDLTIVDADPIISSESINDRFEDPMLTNNNTAIIRGVSNVDCYIQASGKKYATIRDVIVTCGSKATKLQPSNNGYAGLIEGADDGTFIFTVTDSRGNVSSTRVDRELINYTKITCEIDVDMTVVENETANAEVTIRGNFYRCEFGSGSGNYNSSSVYYRYKENNGDYIRTENSDADGWIYAGSCSSTEEKRYVLTSSIENLNSTSVYTFEAKAADSVLAVSSVPYKANAIPVFDWGKDDFCFNVPVDIAGNAWVNGYEVITKNYSDRITRAVTSEEVSYAANSYINFYRSDSASPPNDMVTFNASGIITINRDMTVLINVHVSGHNPSGRSWIRLVNAVAEWRYTQSINYGQYTTSTLSMVLSLHKDDSIGVVTAEALNMNSAGLSPSYIEIIQL